MLKNITKYLPQIVASLFLAGFAISVQAGIADNVSSFAWSENIGWVSLNNTSGGGATNYGVNIASSTGAFSGFAWSENIGWINFAPAGPYPALPSYSTKVDLATGEVSGWARALASGGGWDGWIKMRGTSYGVSINRTTGAFSGYAWSDMVAGWIKFSGPGYGVSLSDPSLIFNQPPDTPDIDLSYPPNGVSWNNCSVQGLAIPTFHWTYSDSDGDPQAAYEIWLDDNFGFPGAKFNYLADPSASFAYALNLSQDDNSDWLPELAWGQTYYWKVRVKDDRGNWSDWLTPQSFSTPVNAYPWPDFTWSPANPSQGELVKFNDETFFYDGIGTFYWDFDDSQSTTTQNPNHAFSGAGNYNVSLRATDGSGNSCTTPPVASYRVPVSASLPEWQEVNPF